MYGGMMGGWGPLFMTINTLMVVALLAAAAVVVYRMLQRPGGESRSRAEQMLDERYARGEIDRADYEERRAAIVRR